ncbi:hypothetical protein B0H67DRAFT_640304 [Lasiosphaeris hirsuta]|uniref:Uncharacterized protein n=1 Tax=Lasiosphaeris hirsuta TaxID=260670 RepID=A0AA40EC58_9PEZI|nr:hypothetical protein B0H67DRAFT_640304 [Lasiosphaeris hirsuta]
MSNSNLAFNWRLSAYDTGYENRPEKAVIRIGHWGSDWVDVDDGADERRTKKMEVLQKATALAQAQELAEMEEYYTEMGGHHATAAMAEQREAILKRHAAVNAQIAATAEEMAATKRQEVADRGKFSKEDLNVTGFDPTDLAAVVGKFLPHNAFPGVEPLAPVSDPSQGATKAHLDAEILAATEHTVKTIDTAPFVVMRLVGGRTTLHLLADRESNRFRFNVDSALPTTLSDDLKSRLVFFREWTKPGCSSDEARYDAWMGEVKHFVKNYRPPVRVLRWWEPEDPIHDLPIEVPDLADLAGLLPTGQYQTYLTDLRRKVAKEVATQLKVPSAVSDGHHVICRYINSPDYAPDAELQEAQIAAEAFQQIRLGPSPEGPLLISPGQMHALKRAVYEHGTTKSCMLADQVEAYVIVFLRFGVPLDGNLDNDTLYAIFEKMIRIVHILLVGDIEDEIHPTQYPIPSTGEDK